MVFPVVHPIIALVHKGTLTIIISINTVKGPNGGLAQGLLIMCLSRGAGLRNAVEDRVLALVSTW